MRTRRIEWTPLVVLGLSLVILLLFIVYPLSRVPVGFYGPREVLKNKPLEHGVIERAPLLPIG